MIAKVIKSEVFKYGDIICEYHNYIAGFFAWFRANHTDVQDYSGKGKTYLKMVLTKEFKREVSIKRNLK